MKKEFVKIMNQHYWSEISEQEAYDALLILFKVNRSLPTNEEIGLRIKGVIKKRYPYIKASVQDEIESEILKQGFLECVLWLQER